MISPGVSPVISPVISPVVSPVISIDTFLLTGRFGSLPRGATREKVLATLGPPDDYAFGGPVMEAAYWVYGETCRGHIELHFDDGAALRSIYSDYLPLRRQSWSHLRVDPGCLGGLVPPSVDKVLARLGELGLNGLAVQPRDPRWADPCPPADLPRVAVADWKKRCRGLDAASIEARFHSELRLPSGVILGIQSHIAALPSGDRIAQQDHICVLSAPYDRDAADGPANR